MISIAVVAHIDHGKSTFCDRLIEGFLGIKLDGDNPSLDAHEIEKTRGVTICNHYITLPSKFGEIYIIDTPGHYDFSNYVTVGILMCDYVFLLIDVTKGVQAQTIFYLKKCVDNKKSIVLIINKIDYEDYVTATEIEEIIKKYLIPVNIFHISAKTGQNIDILMNYIHKLTSEYKYTPAIGSTAKTEFIILDYCKDKYKGLSLMVKITKGTVISNSFIKINNVSVKILHIYLNYLEKLKVNSVSEGQFATIHINLFPFNENSIIGMKYSDGTLNFIFKLSSQCVYIGIYSGDSDQTKVRNSVYSLALSDTGITIDEYYHNVYGTVYYCGLYGTFHRTIFLDKMKMIKDVHLNCFAPDPVILVNGKYTINIDAKAATVNFRKYLEQVQYPFYFLRVQSDIAYFNKINSYLLQDLSGVIVRETYFLHNNFIMAITIPFSIFIGDFVNILKGITNGYVDLIVDSIQYEKTSLSLLEVFINKEKFEHLSCVEVSSRAMVKAKNLQEFVLAKMERQQFELKLNIAINGRFVISDIIKPYRKDVTGKCYGRDASRKKKLLLKQKKGKKKMLGKANIDEIKNVIVAKIKN